MHTLISFATAWGSKHGGINSFNTDFLEHFFYAYSQQVQVICIVAQATPEDVTKAEKIGVTLISLALTDGKEKPNTDHVPSAVKKLQEITYNPAKTICLGHDSITGAIALGVAQETGAQSALIHHMSYDHYEAFSENIKSEIEKKSTQKSLFQQADILLAVGPLLEGALHDLIDQSKKVSRLVPGLASIEYKQPATTFTAFMSGRFSNSTKKLKQDYLGVAGVCQAHNDAKQKQDTTLIAKRPKLTIYGVSLDDKDQDDLRAFAQPYANGQIILNSVPFTENKEDMFKDLAQSHVALMPSWHEGFGLVAWEAIAACVPLIITKESGVYQLLQEEHLASLLDSSFIHPILPQGSSSEPFFTADDVNNTSEKVTKIAKDVDVAKKTAQILKAQLSDKYTWSACAEQAAQAFQWNLQKGSIPTALITPVQHSAVNNITTIQTLTPAQLLSAENAVVPFDSARQPDLDGLITWLDDTTHPIAIRLITGEGGVGKTRLAQELCQQKRPDAHLWLAVEDNNTSWLKEKLPQQPTLIVIDYAETRQTQLINLITELKKVPNAQTVRILLIARDAGEWWDDLPAKASGSSQELLSSYARSGPFKLNPMYTPEARPQAFDNALTAFAQHLSLTKPNLQLPLDHDYFARPLYIQMAALLSLYGEKRGSAQDLTRALINHEKRYWGQALQATEFSADNAQQLMVIATLTGHLATAKDAHKLWQSITEDRDTSLTQFTQLFHALKPLYPNNKGLPPLTPDLLGEALVAQTLNADRLPRLLPVLLSSKFSSKTRQYCLTVLARLSNHYQELENTLVEALKETLTQCVKDLVTVATETPSKLPSYAEQTFQQLPNNTQGQIAGQLKTNIKTKSIQLNYLYATVAKYLYNKSNSAYQNKSTTDNKIALSRALIAYAICLARIGHYDEAVKYDKEALEIVQELARHNPTKHNPELAISYNNSAVHLSEMGNYEQALTYAQQAHNIYKKLTIHNPDKYEPNLASSLNNLASRLSEMGNYEQALTHAQQAHNIYKKLTIHNPDKYEPNLASSLNNLAARLSKMGNYEQALTYAQQAHNIYKKLTIHNPDKYEPDLAISLNNLANHLSDLGKYSQALEYTQQALDIRKKLATLNPDKYEPDLASSLNNLANHLSATGNYEPALEHSKQATTTYKQLADRYPDKFTDDSIGSNLNHLMCEWLASLGTTTIDSSLINTPITQASAHKQAIFLIAQHWLTAINSTEDNQRTELFGEILNDWKQLNTADKLTFQAYYLCALLYLQQNEPSLLIQQGINTQQTWRDYATQRNHRIPAWMNSVIQRLALEIPS
jgi:tetratricopeptide (TPR) repeat protein/glycosyltransferase involved in cell wall biosynthesis